MDAFAIAPGPGNALTDVAGVHVGHLSLTGGGWLTGTSVVLLPPTGSVAGVDIRGAAPGTRETDLLDPTCLVDRVHAIVLSGGSAFGLAATDGVMAGLYAAGRGWPMGAPAEVVPIVPASVIYDMGRGGRFSHHPDGADGRRALDLALAGEAGTGGAAERAGRCGAGTGARAGSLAGGLGSASAVLPDGATVAAVVVVNAIGSPVHPVTGELLALSWGLPGEFPALARPAPSELAAYAALRHTEAAAAGLLPGGATTIGVIATDATLTKAQCRKLAGAGHDGLARAISPVHTMLDGDTLFAVATGVRPEPGLADLLALHDAAAGCVARAVGHALLAATSVTMWPGTDKEQRVRCYLDAFPSARMDR
ncbi:MAG: P1 family peptidase [Tetrasphaera sp.]